MDPRTSQVAPNQRSTNDSPFMAALRKSNGALVNGCPFGCGHEDLDKRGYCRHLVGFTNDGEVLEPLVRTGEDEVKVVGPGLKDKPKKVQPGDVLVKITTSSRVYRQVPGPREKAPENAA